MSRTKSVGLRGTAMWVYDASLSLVLAELITLVEGAPSDERPGWWPGVVRDLRVQAVISDFFFDLDLGLSDQQRAELAELFDQAAELVRVRQVFTADEAAAWPVLDDIPVIFRGSEPEPTGPAAELGHAVAELIRGTLPPSPPGTSWFYGSPGGRRTIGTPTAS
ncbi:hypothetical protein WEI85_11325 [Actinomycetes bacterium KLBMP 9797]